MSNVDPTVPSSPIAYTADIRRNFEIIKQEIEAIQAYVAANQNNDSPTFGGTIHAVNADFTGDVNIDGDLTVGAGVLGSLMSLGTLVTVTAQVVSVPWAGTIRKISDTIWWINGFFQNNTGAPLGTNILGKFPGTLGIIPGVTPKCFAQLSVAGFGYALFVQDVDGVKIDSSAFLGIGEQMMINGLILMQ